MAVITGAGRGIGRATALRLAAEGALIVLGDLDPEPLEALSAELPGPATVTYAGNTADPEQATALIQMAVEAFGAVDILVNNAGTTRDRMFHRQDAADLEAALDANLRTAWNATQAALAVMRPAAKAELAASGVVDHQRKIVFTSSVAALTGNPGQANYTAAKGALIALVRTLAQELGPFGINVNAVAPGFVETRMTAAKGEGDAMGIPEATRQMIVAMTAVGRPGRPEDIAAVHAFLASSDSDFVSGVTIPVAGGMIGAM